MVRIRAFQARGPGSIPGRCTLLLLSYHMIRVHIPPVTIFSLTRILYSKVRAPNITYHIYHTRIIYITYVYYIYLEDLQLGFESRVSPIRVYIYIYISLSYKYILVSLDGQDTRFSPWRPGFDSRTRNTIHIIYI